MIAATANQTDRTATEVQALEQEKVMMLGPVLERLHTELLDPLVTNAFGFMVEYNMLPEVRKNSTAESFRSSMSRCWQKPRRTHRQTAL